MATQNPLDITDVSFDGAKQKLLDFFSNQDQFKGYDFSGANLNAIIDLLTYVGVNGGLYNAFSYRESFPKTAKIRRNVVRHSQKIGFTPLSRAAASLELVITYPNGNARPIFDETDQFAVAVNNDSYQFGVFDNYNLVVTSIDDNDAGDHRLLLTIHQGTLNKRATRLNKDSNSFVLADVNIDYNSIQVRVNDVVWKRAEDHTQVTDSSEVHHIRENSDGEVEVVFGLVNAETPDFELPIFVGGKLPLTGDVITVTYVTTGGDVANGVVDSVQYAGTKNITIESDEVVSLVSGGGLDRQDLEKIKSITEFLIQAQNRAVTSKDYESIISAKFPNLAKSIRAWGDETRPGLAFIASQPEGKLFLTTAEKTEIQNYINKFNILTILPVIIDPNYLYIQKELNVDYDKSKLVGSQAELRESVVNAIESYYDENVNNFGASFHNSRMLNYVDSSDPSILGSSADIHIIREESKANEPSPYDRTFYNPVKSVVSDPFTLETERDGTTVSAVVSIKDDGQGNLVAGSFEEDSAIQEFLQFSTKRYVSYEAQRSTVTTDSFASGAVLYDLPLDEFTVDANVDGLTSLLVFTDGLLISASPTTYQLTSESVLTLHKSLFDITGGITLDIVHVLTLNDEFLDTNLVLDYQSVTSSGQYISTDFVSDHPITSDSLEVYIAGRRVSVVYVTITPDGQSIFVPELTQDSEATVIFYNNTSTVVGVSNLEPFFVNNITLGATHTLPIEIDAAQFEYSVLPDGFSDFDLDNIMVFEGGEFISTTDLTISRVFVDAVPELRLYYGVPVSGVITMYAPNTKSLVYENATGRTESQPVNPENGFIIVGTVDYSTGAYNIDELADIFSSLGMVRDQFLRLYAEPVNDDVYSERESIITFDSSNDLLLTLKLTGK